MRINPHSGSREQRLVRFITWTNWVLLAGLVLTGLTLTESDFAWGMLCGGLLVTINFHLLYRTLKKTFQSSLRPSSGLVMIKYYIRFFGSGLILYILVSRHLVDPVGLITGLSVVVASMMLATLCELKHILFGEAM